MGLRFATGLFSAAYDPATRIGDLTGKVVLVTGANAGMGYMISEQLALHGAKVWMGARSESRAEEAIQTYDRTHAKTTNKGSIFWLPLDLTTPKDIPKFVELFLSSETRLDILVLKYIVNNAARNASPYELTEDDLELSVAINHVGHFALVQALLPILKHTAALPNSDVRVITVSSVAHALIKDIVLEKKSDLNVTYAANPSSINTFQAKQDRYHFTKLLNILFASELQRRVDNQNIPIISMSIHPGIVATETGLNLFPSWLRPILRRVGLTPLQGAVSALFASTAAEVKLNREEYKGSYLGPGGMKGLPSKIAQDEETAKRLWSLTERIVEEITAGRSNGLFI